MKLKKEMFKNLNIEEFKTFYYTHSNKDVCSKFNLKTYQLLEFLELFDIIPKTAEQKNAIIRNAILSKTDDEKALAEEKRKQTCMEKYGCTNPMKNADIASEVSVTIRAKTEEEKLQKTQKFRQTMKNKSDEEKKLIRENRSRATSEHFKNMTAEEREAFSKTMSDAYFSLSEEEKRSRIDKGIATKKSRYGANFGALHYDVGRDKLIETNLSKYGVPYFCMTPQCRNALGGNASNTKPNNDFAELLTSLGISFEREFVIGTYSYDFKVDNTLIEIDPTATHNSSWSPFGDTPHEKYYHRDKTLCAKKNGYRCVHIFDWDDTVKIAKLLMKRKRVYARQCAIKEISYNEACEFLRAYHLQGSAKSSIQYGLYYADNLVSVMTFDKPRYNKNYDFELIRYCSSYDIVGGAEKLFHHFIAEHKGVTVISYCDDSKFSGNTYMKLGFTHINSNVSKHWYNMKTKQHITDNLLRQRGFDQLFNTNYGKGTDNCELMLSHGFVEVYDVGQSVYVYKP